MNEYTCVEAAGENFNAISSVFQSSKDPKDINKLKIFQNLLLNPLKKDFPPSKISYIQANSLFSSFLCHFLKTDEITSDF